MNHRMQWATALAVVLALAVVWTLPEGRPLDGAAIRGPSPAERGGARRPGGETPSPAQGGPGESAGADRSARRVARSSASIAGWVVDTAGHPLAGAAVVCSSGGTQSADDDGAFRLEGLPAGEHWLWAQAPDHAALPAPPVRAGEGARVEGVRLVLAPARVLAGRVLTIEGSTVEAARIEAVVHSIVGHDGRPPRFGPWSTPSVVYSDARGDFRLGPLPEGQVLLTVTHADHATLARIYPTSGEDLSIALTPVGAIHGRVVAEAGDRALPIERASLLVSSGEDAGGPWRLLGQPLELAPDEGLSGRFRLRARTRHWLRVVVEGPRFQRVVSPPFQIDESFGYGPLVLRARGGARLSGLVRDERGQPVPAAQVTVVDGPGAAGMTWSGAAFASRASTSGPDGRFELAPLPPGSYRLEARCAGHFPGDLEPLTIEEGAQAPPLELVLARAGAIRGRVWSREGGALPDLQVHARLVTRSELAEDERGGPDPRWVRSPESGFHFPCLEPGLYSVRLLEAGQSEPLLEQQVEVLLGREARVDVDLDAGGHARLHGRVRRNGVPLPFAAVSLGRSPQGSAWRCRTDRAGGFRFAGVGEGTLFLVARAGADGTTLGCLRLEVSRGEELSRDLDVSTGTIAGRVLDQARRPLARGRVLIELEMAGFGLHRVADLETDREGRFECARVPAGQLLLSTDIAFHANVRGMPIIVAERGTTSVPDLALASRGSLAIHLKRSPGPFLASEFEVEVRRRADGTLTSTQRFSQGERIVLTELPPGPASVLVRRLVDGSQATVQAAVTASRMRTVIVRF